MPPPTVEALSNATICPSVRRYFCLSVCLSVSCPQLRSVHILGPAMDKNSNRKPYAGTRMVSVAAESGRNRNEDVTGVASDAFARWLHRRHAAVKLPYRRWHIVTSRDILLTSMKCTALHHIFFVSILVQLLPARRYTRVCWRGTCYNFVSVCLSVRPSVTSRCSIETADQIASLICWDLTSTYRCCCCCCCNWYRVETTSTFEQRSCGISSSTIQPSVEKFFPYASFIYLSKNKKNIYAFRAYMHIKRCCHVTVRMMYMYVGSAILIANNRDFARP